MGHCCSDGDYSMRVRDNNVEAVRQKLLIRSQIGIAKYGCTTERNDLSDLDWIKHCQEELLDAAVYLEAMIQRMSK